ncbi:MAG: winged helix-turn-helix transcriptional regulator [Thiolinea sp.]
MIKLDRATSRFSVLQQQGRITKTALAEKVNLSPAPRAGNV